MLQSFATYGCCHPCCFIFQIESLDDKFAKLDAKDREITAALEEKHRILTEILNIPPEEYDTIVDITRASTSSKGLDTRQALLSIWS